MDSQIKNPDSFVAKESICNNTVPPCGEMDIQQTTLKRRFVHALFFYLQICQIKQKSIRCMSGEEKPCPDRKNNHKFTLTLQSNRKFFYSFNPALMQVLSYSLQSQCYLIHAFIQNDTYVPCQISDLLLLLLINKQRSDCFRLVSCPHHQTNSGGGSSWMLMSRRTISMTNTTK